MTDRNRPVARLPAIEEDGGTRVDVIADDVPGGNSADDHAEGLASSLDNLAQFVES